MVTPLHRLLSLAALTLALAAPGLAQEDGGDEPAPEQPVTILVSPGNQGVLGLARANRILVVNLSQTQDTAIRYFWIYNAELPPEGASISVRAGETKVLEPEGKKIGGRTILPNTFLVFNNGMATAAIHKLGD